MIGHRSLCHFLPQLTLCKKNPHATQICQGVVEVSKLVAEVHRSQLIMHLSTMSRAGSNLPISYKQSI